MASGSVNTSDDTSWTSISYDWVNFKTRAFSFLASTDPDCAAIKFEELHPRENLLALVPGDHACSESLRVYKLSIVHKERQS